MLSLSLILSYVIVIVIDELRITITITFQRFVLFFQLSTLLLEVSQQSLGIVDSVHGDLPSIDFVQYKFEFLIGIPLDSDSLAGFQ